MHTVNFDTEDTYDRRPTIDDVVKSRGRRLFWLDKLIIPNPDAKKAKDKDSHPRSAMRMKNLLRVIEGHDRANAGQALSLKTLAQGMGCKTDRTVRRAIEDCRAVGLLSKRDVCSNGRVSVYKIQWHVVAQMILDNPATIRHIAPHEARCLAPQTPRELPFDTDEPRTLAPETPDTCAGEPRTLAPGTPDTCAGNPGHLRLGRGGG